LVAGIFEKPAEGGLSLQGAVGMIARAKARD
jgi:hypothetical protein